MTTALLSAQKPGQRIGYHVTGVWGRKDDKNIPLLLAMQHPSFNVTCHGLGPQLLMTGTRTG